MSRGELVEVRLVVVSRESMESRRSRKVEEGELGVERSKGRDSIGRGEP